jgi:hypothetical protein
MPSAGLLSLVCTFLFGAHTHAQEPKLAQVSTPQTPSVHSIIDTAQDGGLLLSNQLSADNSADNASSIAQMPSIIGRAQLNGVFFQPVVRYTNIPADLLNTSNPTDRVAAVISSNEGTPTTIDWNDNGCGVSVGIFQANQRVGELPQLLHQLAVIPEGQQQLTNAFGMRATQQIQQNPEAIRRWHFSPKNSLGHGLQRLVQSRLFQQLQIAVLRHKVTSAAVVAADYGITCTAGVAVCADLTNQWGCGGARRFLRAAQSANSQNEKVTAIVAAVTKGSQYGSRYQADLHKFQGNGLSFNEPFIAQANDNFGILETTFEQ